MSETPHYVTCHCHSCKGNIEFDAVSAGETVSCLHCGLETTLCVPPTVLNKSTKPVNHDAPSAAPRDVHLEIKRGVSPLGIAALALGILSCLFCWIPLLGLLAVPLAFIGLLLAFAGIVIASINRKTGFCFPISGAIVCILSIFITCAVTGVISAVVKRGRRTNQESQSQSYDQGKKQSATQQTDWSRSLAVKQGNVKVIVSGVRTGPVRFKDALGNPQTTQEGFFQISLLVTNLSATKKVDFETWQGVANLQDNNQNKYKQVNIEAGWWSKDRVSIHLRKEHLDTIVFEIPVENINWLHLELPADNFGGSGMLRFEIPMNEISAARDEVKNAQADYHSFLADKPFLTNADYIRIEAEKDSELSQLRILEQREKAASRLYSDEQRKNILYRAPGEAKRRQATLDNLRAQHDLIRRQLASQSATVNQLKNQLNTIEQAATAVKYRKLEAAISRLARAEKLDEPPQ